MIPAIYARKSTEQTGISDEARSIARQVEHARAYATRKGWHVAEGTSRTTGSPAPSSPAALGSSGS